MFTLINLSLQRGGKTLLENVNFRVNPGNRVGLLGNNGSGKTTLLKLLLGQLDADTGEVLLPCNTRVATAEQEFIGQNRKAIDFVLDGHQPLRDLEQQLRTAETKNNGLEIAEIHHKLDAISAYNAKFEAAKLLSGLGFSETQQQKSILSFSGGWQMRLNLAKALMCPSDLLLLDEPTNHLDLDAVFWLEDWIKKYSGTLLLVSHDVIFLDAVVTHIAHLEDLDLTLYSGNYSAFTVQRAAKISLQASLAQKQQRKRDHLESFVKRFKAKASKAKQAQSRIKMLEKLKRISFVQVNNTVSFNFKNPKHLPRPMMYWKNVSAGYSSIILNEVDFSLSPGSRIGLIGRNGAGKSTFIKAIANVLPLVEGEIYRADNLLIGYFSQHQIETLNLQESALWHLRKIAPATRDQELKNFLAGFGFKGDRVEQIIAPFSGGEKSRLALALIIWTAPNLLLLDEPTNHLDLDSRAALIEALQEFTGSIILVSHDRFLLEACCDSYLLVDASTVNEFEGNLNDYKTWLFENNKFNTQKKLSIKKTRKDFKYQQAINRQKLSPLKKEITQVESKLELHQLTLNQLESRLSHSEIYQQQNNQQLHDLLVSQKSHKLAIAKLEETWLVLQHKLECLQKEVY